MIYITDDSIEKFIKEDVPYLDLTTEKKRFYAAQKKCCESLKS